MTTPMPVTLTCPCCGHEFESMSLRSTNTCGPLTTDLYRHAGGFPSLPLMVHGCTQCGYSGHIGDFDPEEVTAELKEWVRTNLKPIPNRFSTGAKYQMKAKAKAKAEATRAPAQTLTSTSTSYCPDSFGDTIFNSGQFPRIQRRSATECKAASPHSTPARESWNPAVTKPCPALTKAGNMGSVADSPSGSSFGPESRSSSHSS